MKRIISLLLTLSCFLFAGCTFVASGDVLDYADRAVEIGEEYLNAEISSSEAEEKLSILERGIKAEDKESVANSALATDIALLSIAIYSDGYHQDAESYKKVKDAIDELQNDMEEYD